MGRSKKRILNPFFTVRDDLSIALFLYLETGRFLRHFVLFLSERVLLIAEMTSRDRQKR